MPPIGSFKEEFENVKLCFILGGIIVFNNIKGQHQHRGRGGTTQAYKKQIH